MGVTRRFPKRSAISPEIHSRFYSRSRIVSRWVYEKPQNEIVGSFGHSLSTLDNDDQCAHSRLPVTGKLLSGNMNVLFSANPPSETEVRVRRPDFVARTFLRRRRSDSGDSRVRSISRFRVERHDDYCPPSSTICRTNPSTSLDQSLSLDRCRARPTSRGRPRDRLDSRDLSMDVAEYRERVTPRRDRECEEEGGEGERHWARGRIFPWMRWVTGSIARKVGKRRDE